MPAVERSFVFTQEAWYTHPAVMGEDNPLYARYEVLIHVNAPDKNGGFAVRWHMDNQSPRLEMYSDSWGLMPYVTDLFRWLESQHDRDFTPHELCHALRSLGMTDTTARELPPDTAMCRPDLVEAMKKDPQPAPRSRPRKPSR